MEEHTNLLTRFNHNICNKSSDQSIRKLLGIVWFGCDLDDKGMEDESISADDIAAITLVEDCGDHNELLGLAHRRMMNENACYSVRFTNSCDLPTSTKGTRS